MAHIDTHASRRPPASAAHLCILRAARVYAPARIGPVCTRASPSDLLDPSLSAAQDRSFELIPPSPSPTLILASLVAFGRLLDACRQFYSFFWTLIPMLVAGGTVVLVQEDSDSPCLWWSCREKNVRYVHARFLDVQNVMFRRFYEICGFGETSGSNEASSMVGLSLPKHRSFRSNLHLQSSCHDRRERTHARGCHLSY